VHGDAARRGERSCCAPAIPPKIAGRQQRCHRHSAHSAGRGDAFPAGCSTAICTAPLPQATVIPFAPISRTSPGVDSLTARCKTRSEKFDLGRL
jgi:hypothetical protein